jgi:hypothetical protein
MPPASAPSILRLVEYLCPCGHVVVRLKEGLTYLGAPQRRCARCGREALVSQYCEWADMTGAQRQMTVRRAVLSTIFLGSAIGVGLVVLASAATVIARLPEPDVLLAAGISFQLGPAAIAALQILRVRASLARTRAADGSPD